MFHLHRVDELLAERRKAVRRLAKLEAEIVVEFRKAALLRLPGMLSNAGLSQTEYRIAGLLAGGQRCCEIAALLNNSKKTLSVHVNHINRKLGTRSSLEIAAWWHRQQGELRERAAEMGVE